MHYHSFWMPKQGNMAEEYEDAYAGDPASGRFAIADGATESSFAGCWARLLVQDFVQLPAGSPAPWATWLPPLQQRWIKEVSGRPLPWYAEIKLEQGAFATFLGLVVEESEGGPRWSAVAVGDSCLFQVRGAGLHRAFPITRSEEFGSAPWLVGSRSPAAEIEEKKEVQAAGDGQSGDQLWLMTDALAQWFLRQHEAGHKPWEDLEAFLAQPAGEAAFSAWVQERRDSRELRNDDVTLVALCL